MSGDSSRYFYRSQYGALVGDIFMTPIHSAELSGASPFEYLTALQQNAGGVRSRPAERLPWNYQEALRALDTS